MAEAVSRVSVYSGSDDSEIVQIERKRWLFFALPLTFTKYTLTNRKLILNQGLLTSTEDEILLYRILDLTLSRNLIQKIFGLGTIIVEAQDKTDSILVIKNIKNSRQFKENLSRLVEQEKLRLRMRRGEIINDYDDDCSLHDSDYNDRF
ncbi:MAG: PH domain-containing protein [Acutalibacteraceae bacterium]